MTSLTSDQNNLCVKQTQKINVNGLGNFISRFVQLVKRTNHNQRTRLQLSRLSDHALKDIGLTKADAFEELNKPLWK